MRIPCRYSRRNSSAHWPANPCRSSVPTWSSCAATAHLTGEVRWNPRESLADRARRRTSIPRCFGHDLPGKLSFRFRRQWCAVRRQGGAGHRLRQAGRQAAWPEAAAGEGQILRAAGSDLWQFQGVNLRFGKTHIQLDGKLGAAARPRLHHRRGRPEPARPGGTRTPQRARTCRRAPGQRVAQLKAKGTELLVAGYRAGRRWTPMSTSIRGLTADARHVELVRISSTADGACRPCR